MTRFINKHSWCFLNGDLFPYNYMVYPPEVLPQDFFTHGRSPFYGVRSWEDGEIHRGEFIFVGAWATMGGNFMEKWAIGGDGLHHLVDESDY